MPDQTGEDRSVPLPMTTETRAELLLEAIEELRYRRGRLSRVTVADLVPVLVPVLEAIDRIDAERAATRASTGAGLDELVAKLPPGPYYVQPPDHQGGLYVIWGKYGTPPDFKDGWAIPIVASGVDTAMYALCEILNRLAAARLQDPPEPEEGTMTEPRRRTAALARHFGDANHDGHRPTSAFDFYCVAHGEDYSPKYMGGVVCHDGFGEGLCADECNRCPVMCPIEPCPIPEPEPEKER